jgi:hypothetical protein
LCWRESRSTRSHSYRNTRILLIVPIVYAAHRSYLMVKSFDLQPEAVRSRLRDTRKFVEVRLRDLRKLLNGEPRIARAAIGKHVQKITLKPEGRTYIPAGSWDLLGAGAVAVSMVPGARIELATPAFSGRRSTNELPRHLHNIEIVGAL